MNFAARGLSLGGLKCINAALGTVISICVAMVFGAGSEVDALFTATFLSLFIGRELTGIVTIALTPCLVEEQERDEPSSFLAAFRVWNGTAALVLSGVVWLYAAPAVRIIAPGLDETTAGQTIRFVRLLSPCVGCYALLGAVHGFYYARRSFYVPEMGELLWRAVALASLFLVGRTHGMEAYVGGLTLASLTQCALLVVLGRQVGYSLAPRPWVGFPIRVLKPFWHAALTLIVGSALGRVVEVVDWLVLSFLGEGAIATYTYGNRLAFLLPGLLAVSLMTPFLPEVSQMIARKQDFRRFGRQIGLFLSVVGVPIGIVLYWAADDMVTILLVRGRFDAESGRTVAAALKAFAVGIPAYFCGYALRCIFLWQRNTAETTRIGILFAAMRVAGNLLLAPFGVVGIALSGSLSMWLIAGYMWMKTRTGEPLGFAWARFALAASVLSALLFPIPWRSLAAPPILALGLGAAVATGSYLLLMWPTVHWMKERLEATRTRGASG